jgi:DNA-directed RNA polymerase subunit L
LINVGQRKSCDLKHLIGYRASNIGKGKTIKNVIKEEIITKPRCSLLQYSISGFKYTRNFHSTETFLAFHTFTGKIAVQIEVKTKFAYDRKKIVTKASTILFHLALMGTNTRFSLFHNQIIGLKSFEYSFMHARVNISNNRR